MGPYYKEKKTFLETFFETLTKESKINEKGKHIMLDEFTIRTASLLIDNTESIFILGLREHDNAICLFDRIMDGSDCSDSFNVFDDAPYFVIVPEYERKGFFYKCDNKAQYRFTKGIVIHRQIAVLLERFVETYNASDLFFKEKKRQY